MKKSYKELQAMRDKVYQKQKGLKNSRKRPTATFAPSEARVEGIAVKRTEKELAEYLNRRKIVTEPTAEPTA